MKMNQLESEVQEMIAKATAAQAATIAELKAALISALNVINEQQGEWVSVSMPYAPEWTHPLKEEAEDIDALLAKLEAK